MSNKSISISSPDLLPLVLEGPKSTAFNLPRRIWKLGLAGGVLFAGMFGILTESKYVSTNDAVASTYVLSVRTPVDGTVTGLPIAAGVNVQSGELLGQLDNPLLDHQHLDNLQALRDAADSTAGAIINEQRALNAQRADLVTRSEGHATAVSERLNHQIIEAERLLAVRQLALDQANTEANRARQLHDLGVIASADFEKLLSAKHIAAEELAAQQAELESVRAQALAASHGVLTEPGTSSDVSYSQQRADEISIKLAENQRTLITSRAQAVEAEIAIHSESERSNLMHHASLQSPIDGLVWKINAVDGEHASAGDTILSLVDCKRQVILAEVPHDRVPDIAVQKTARFRLAGEESERTGTVLTVSGTTLRETESKLAALPPDNAKKKRALVLIGLDALPSGSGNHDGEECMVGRSVHVLIPTTSTNVVMRWFRN